MQSGLLLQVPLKCSISIGLFLLFFGLLLWDDAQQLWTAPKASGSDFTGTMQRSFLQTRRPVPQAIFQALPGPTATDLQSHHIHFRPSTPSVDNLSPQSIPSCLFSLVPGLLCLLLGSYFSLRQVFSGHEPLPWAAASLGPEIDFSRHPPVPKGPFDGVIAIRPATKDDIPITVAVINQAFMADAFFKKEAYHNRTSEREMAATMKLPGSCYLLATTSEGAVIGAVLVGWDATSRKGFFGQLAVANAFQKKGVGKCLVQAAEEWCQLQSMGNPFIMEIPIVSVRPDLFEFYEKLGYQEARTIPFGYPDMLSGQYDVKFVIYQKSCGANDSLPSVDIGLPPLPGQVRATAPTSEVVPQVAETTPIQPVTSITPVPWVQVVSVGFTLFVNHFGAMVVMPFIPFMVADFFPMLSKAQLGMKVGYMFSSFYLGQLAGAYLWGLLADKFGRRPALILGSVGTLLTMPLFGICSTFHQALLVRFLWGFLNGSKVVCKVYLGEILDRSNAALGFSILGIQSSIGRWLGPLVGGLMAYPAAKYAILANVTLLRAYPYLLPCLVGGVVAAAGILIAFLNLPETLGQSQSGAKESKVESNTDMSSALREPAFTTAVALSLVTYTGFCFAHIGFEQIFPLWLLRDPANGGFNFREEEIGSVVSMTGPVQLLTQVTLVPWFARRVSYRAAWQVALLWMALGVIIAPWASLANGFQIKWLPWVAASLVYMLVNVPAEAAYTYGAIVVNDCVTKAHRGKINGIAASATAAVRMIGPVLWGTLFAMTASGTLVRALDWRLAFLLISGLLAIMASCVKLIQKQPESSNNNLSPVAS